MGKWYDKNNKTFRVITKDSMSVYELDELYNYPKLEIFNFLDEDLAYETVKSEIAVSDNEYKAEDFNIMVAKRDAYSTLLCV